MNSRAGRYYLVCTTDSFFEVFEDEGILYNEDKVVFYLSEEEAKLSYYEYNIKKLQDEINKFENFIKGREKYIIQMDDYFNQNYKNE